jgi:hypothetical protein
MRFEVFMGMKMHVVLLNDRYRYVVLNPTK